MAPPYFKPKAYSLWHREKLPSDFWYADIDGVEVRRTKDGTRLAAFFELVETERPLDEITKGVILEEKGFVLECILFPLSKLSQVPIYVVYHGPKCQEFKVFAFKGGEFQGFSQYKEGDYITFLESL